MAVQSKESLYQSILKRKLEGYAKKLEAELASLSLHPNIKSMNPSGSPRLKSPFTNESSRKFSKELTNNNRIKEVQKAKEERMPWDMSNRLGAAIPLHNSVESPGISVDQRFSGIGKALSQNAKRLGVAAMLAGSLGTGFGMGATGIVLKETLPTFTSLMRPASNAVEAAVKQDPLVEAAGKIAEIKDPTKFAESIKEASKLPDVQLPADIVGKTPDQLTKEQNRIRLGLQNQFTLDTYKSGDESQFINRFDNLDRILDKDGNINENFIAGVKEYAPNFAKEHGLSDYTLKGQNGLLESVDKDLQAVYNKAISYGGTKTPFVSQGNRTAEYQHALYKKDRFSNGNFKDINGQATTYADGYISASDHQGAKAIDIVIPGKAQDRATGADKVYGKFNESMQRASKELFGDKYDLEWGGNFVNDDYGHFALKQAEKLALPQPTPVAPKQEPLSAKEAFKKTWSNYDLLESNNPLSKLVNSDTFLRQAYMRKIAPLIGQVKEDPEVVSAFKKTSTDKNIEVKSTHKDIQDVMKLGDRNYHSQILDLDKVKLGTRNRGDYNTINSSTGIVGTTFEGFVRPQDDFVKTFESGKQEIVPKRDNMGVLGVDDKGNFVKGNYSDFKNRTDVRITPMAHNRIVDFKEDAQGNQMFKHPPGFAASARTPIVRALNDDGTINENASLGFITGDGNMNKYGQSDGARIVMMNPDTKKTYLVSGSGQELKDAFALIKGKSKYLDTWKLDNGTFVKGLSRDSGVLDGNTLREYDRTNRGGGGNGFYVKD